MNRDNSLPKTIVNDITGRIHTIEELNQALTKKEWDSLIIQGLDLCPYEEQLMGIKISHSIFLGCTLSTQGYAALADKNLIFSQPQVPYDVFRPTLYTKEALYDQFTFRQPESYEQTLDCKIYRHYLATGDTTPDVVEKLARTLHDFSLRTAMKKILRNYDSRHVIAIMGGHQLERGSRQYRQISYISKQLTEAGKLMTSGGGPGAMEATHLGAWFAGKKEEALVQAIELLAQAPRYKDQLWLSKAYEVLGQYPESDYRSLSIPTWTFGHEPATPFASDICKLFENSLREEDLLAIAIGGVIFTPGSAGTIQEVFQDLTQNHYLSYDKASPMIFLGKKFWSEEVPIYPLLSNMKSAGRLQKHVNLYLFDSVEEVLSTLL